MKVEINLNLNFGSVDTRSLRFFDQVENWYFSSLVDNRGEGLRKLVREEYIAKGRDVFDSRSITREMIDDFRRAASGKLNQIDDFGVRTIITTGVERIRSYANVNQLRQGRYKYGKIVAVLDEHTSQVCRYLNGKYIRIAAAAAAIDRLMELTPEDYAQEFHESAAGLAYTQDPVAYFANRIGYDGVIEESLVAEGRSVPPYHPNCRSRVEGVDKEEVEASLSR